MPVGGYTKQKLVSLDHVLPKLRFQTQIDTPGIEGSMHIFGALQWQKNGFQQDRSATELITISLQFDFSIFLGFSQFHDP